jgi:Ca-dependent carbohydrate-binding module xylan-binding
MVRVLVCAAVLVTGSVVCAADADAINLSKFKWKAAFDGGAELGGYDDGEGRFNFYTNGTMTGDVTVPEDGEYTLTVEAGCSEAEKVFAKFKLSVGETVVAKEHALTGEEKKKYTFDAKLKKGKQALVVEFLNDVYKENEFDRNLFVYAVKIEAKK